MPCPCNLKKCKVFSKKCNKSSNFYDSLSCCNKKPIFIEYDFHFPSRQAAEQNLNINAKTVLGDRDKAILNVFIANFRYIVTLTRICEYIQVQYKKMEQTSPDYSPCVLDNTTSNCGFCQSNN